MINRPVHEFKIILTLYRQIFINPNNFINSLVLKYISNLKFVINTSCIL